MARPSSKWSSIPLAEHNSLRSIEKIAPICREYQWVLRGRRISARVRVFFYMITIYFYIGQIETISTRYAIFSAATDQITTLISH